MKIAFSFCAHVKNNTAFVSFPNAAAFVPLFNDECKYMLVRNNVQA